MSGNSAQNSAEDQFIGRWFAPLAGPAGLGLRDDAALYVPLPGCELVVTLDTLVAGVHFLADDPPESIARKLLRVNLSDLAAKGAEPDGFLLSFAMPSDGELYKSDDWLSAFSKALGDDAARYSCSLIGGDTVVTPGPLTLSITAFGNIPAGKMVKRGGAQVGDVIAVSGTIGDAALGLQILKCPHAGWVKQLPRDASNHLIARYREPQPRLMLAAALRDYAHAAMDISDGLAGDLAKMMRVSGTAARVTEGQIPLSVAAQAAVALDVRLVETAVTGGDDYEILCTLPRSNLEALAAAAQQAGFLLTAIGEVVPMAKNDAVFIGANGAERTFARPSYSHFD